MDFSLLRAAAFAFNMAEGEPDWPVVVVTGLVLVFAVLILLYLILQHQTLTLSLLASSWIPCSIAAAWEWS